MDRFVCHQYCGIQSFGTCMDNVFDQTQYIHITWPHFDLDIDLILDLDLFKCSEIIDKLQLQALAFIERSVFFFLKFHMSVIMV